MRLSSHKQYVLAILSLGIVYFCLSMNVLAVEEQTPAGVGVSTGQQPSASDGFTYSSKGRRDPFKPLVQKEPSTAQKDNERPAKIKGPLEKFELSQFRLIAILVVKGAPRAMVKAPDGKSYTLKVGEYIGMNDGIVRKIETKVIEIDDNGMRIEKSPDRVVVEEIGIDNIAGKRTSEYRYIVM